LDFFFVFSLWKIGKDRNGWVLGKEGQRVVYSKVEKNDFVAKERMDGFSALH
jgi:hypothetical protein